MRYMLTNINKNNYYYHLPPHNILAEEIVIGHCLSETIITSKSIDSYLFTLEKHQIIYLNNLKIQDRNNNDESPIPQLINILWSKKLLNKIGGIQLIIELIQKSQTISAYFTNEIHLEYFIDILYYSYTKRLFIQYSYCLLQLSYNSTISAQYIYKQSKQYLQKIATIIKLQKDKQCNNLVKQFLFNFYFKNNPTNNTNILSGFKELDILTKGFKSGDLIIIAGRPSMGKTSLAINIANYIILQLQLSVYIFSLEMSKDEILDKILAIESNIKIKDIQQKVIQTCEWKNLQKICLLLLKANLNIDDEGNASIEYIKSQAKNYKIKKNTIIIDYLQLIKLKKQMIENRSQEISYITRELKLLAKTSQLPCIVLSQLNRSVENRTNKRPLLSDLRESGCISYYKLPNIHKNRTLTQKLDIEILYCKKKNTRNI